MRRQSLGVTPSLRHAKNVGVAEANCGRSRLRQTLEEVRHDQSDSDRAELDLDSREDRTYLSREEGPRAALGNRPHPSAPPYGARAAVAAARASSAYFDITECTSTAPSRADVALGLHWPH